MEERYIHTAMVKNGIKIVVTMFKDIVKRIHTAEAAGNNITYKTTNGNLKPTHVVTFDRTIQKRE